MAENFIVINNLRLTEVRDPTDVNVFWNKYIQFIDMMPKNEK